MATGTKYGSVDNFKKILPKTTVSFESLKTFSGTLITSCYPQEGSLRRLKEGSKNRRKIIVDFEVFAVDQRPKW